MYGSLISFNFWFMGFSQGLAMNKNLGDFDRD